MAKKQKSENAQLAELMDKHAITRPEAAEIMGMTKSCVDQWLRPPGTRNYRPMHERFLRLMQFELGLRAPAFTHVHRKLRSDERER